MLATRRPRKLTYDGVRNGWYAILPDPAPARVLSGDVLTDWAVLGGGACGLSFARRIAELRPNDTVIVVEGMRVGYGTSGRNAGFMLRHHSHGGIRTWTRRNAANASSRPARAIFATPSNNIRFAATGATGARSIFPRPPWRIPARRRRRRVQHTRYRQRGTRPGRGRSHHRDPFL